MWRNHAGLVEALLAAGADPDVPDAESGWTALHRSLHWGQLRCAAALLRADASLVAPDWRSRTPLDLLSAELKEYLEPGDGDVFSWGACLLPALAGRAGRSVQALESLRAPNLAFLAVLTDQRSPTVRAASDPATAACLRPLPPHFGFSTLSSGRALFCRQRLKLHARHRLH